MAGVCDFQTHGLLVLPTELWTEFMNRLEAIDILSLRSMYQGSILMCIMNPIFSGYLWTRKTLHLLLSRPTVWISILGSLSGQDDIYFPSYDIGDMDVQDLRRAATGRHRWGQLLQQNCFEPHPRALNNPPILQPAYGPTKLSSTVLGPKRTSLSNMDREYS
jgi:hypothetical protein